MKIVDEKGRILGLFNIVDILIVITMILVVGIFMMYASNMKFSSSKEEKKVEITYTIECKELSKEVAQAPKIGDKLYDSSNKLVGELVNIESEQSMKINEDSVAGRFIETTIPDRYTVILTIMAAGVDGEKDIRVANNYTIKVGKKAKVKSATYTLEGFILDLKMQDVLGNGGELK